MMTEDTGAELIGTEFTEAEIPHAVYRLYDAERTLLYIGFTWNLRRRMEGHARDKWWWPQVAHRTMVWYGGEWDARKAEAEAIDAEKPLHNYLKPAVGPHVPPHGSRHGWNRTPLIAWHSADPTLRPWIKAEGQYRGITDRELLDEAAALFRARQEGDHAKYAEILESMRESLESAGYRENTERLKAHARLYEEGGKR